MKSGSFRHCAEWLGQISGASALILIAYVRGKYIFIIGNTAGTLLLLATLAAVLTLIFGVAALPGWQGYLSLAIFFFVTYCLLFVPTYAIGCN
jgi:hypothetical protein